MYIFGKERDGKEFLQCNYVISEITLKKFFLTLAFKAFPHSNFAGFSDHMHFYVQMIVF